MTHHHRPTSAPRAAIAHALVMACAITGLATACSAGTTVAGPAAGPASSAGRPAPAVDAGDPSPPTPTTAPCDELASTADRIRTTIEDLSALVGTRQDATSLLDGLADFAPALGGLVPVCEPAAEESMWRFLTGVEELRQRFASGSAGANRLALIEVRTRAADLYGRLGLDGYGWGTTPENARPVCRDLDAIGARMTWDVRHLTNLVGSDNTTDAEGYVVDIRGLTSAIADLIAGCRPEAATAMARFTAAVDNVAEVYLPGADPAVVAANKDALRNLRAEGISLYTRLGLTTDSWEVIPLNAR